VPQGADQERTEDATPKKREEARQKGQVAKSQEVSSVAVLFAVLVVFYFLGGYMVKELLGLMQWSCLVANYSQIGFVLSAYPITPRLSKLDPVQGAKRLVSKRSLVELFKSIMKILMIGAIATLTIRGEVHQIPSLIDLDAGGILITIAKVSLKIVFWTACALVLLAICDYVFQRLTFEKELRMTKQEVKDEFKQREGDPLVKSRVRQIQREMARRRMMEAVPKADVVVTNPTEIAVALEYRSGLMSAPRVTAKGARLIAQRIKEIALKYQVPVVEDKPLAQVLYKTVEVEREIPSTLYKAVAEVLAYVYRIKGKNVAS
jgi:flagellar biosynthetic protein FlhB